MYGTYKFSLYRKFPNKNLTILLKNVNIENYHKIIVIAFSKELQVAYENRIDRHIQQ